MLVIPLNKSASNSNKLVRISENVFTFDGYTIGYEYALKGDSNSN